MLLNPSGYANGRGFIPEGRPLSVAEKAPPPPVQFGFPAGMKSAEILEPTLRS